MADSVYYVSTCVDSKNKAADKVVIYEVSKEKARELANTYADLSEAGLDVLDKKGKPPANLSESYKNKFKAYEELFKVMPEEAKIEMNVKKDQLYQGKFYEPSKVKELEYKKEGFFDSLMNRLGQVIHKKSPEYEKSLKEASKEPVIERLAESHKAKHEQAIDNFEKEHPEFVKAIKQYRSGEDDFMRRMTEKSVDSYEAAKVEKIVGEAKRSSEPGSTEETPDEAIDKAMKGSLEGAGLNPDERHNYDFEAAKRNKSKGGTHSVKGDGSYIARTADLYASLRATNFLNTKDIEIDHDGHRVIYHHKPHEDDEVYELELRRELETSPEGQMLLKAIDSTFRSAKEKSAKDGKFVERLLNEGEYEFGDSARFTVEEYKNVAYAGFRSRLNQAMEKTDRRLDAKREGITLPETPAMTEGYPEAGKGLQMPSRTASQPDDPLYRSRLNLIEAQYRLADSYDKRIKELGEALKGATAKGDKKSTLLFKEEIEEAENHLLEVTNHLLEIDPGLKAEARRGHEPPAAATA